MAEWVDNGVLAGLSATLGFYLLCAAAGMGWLTWRYRARFAHWSQLSTNDKGDAILNLSLFGFMLHATYSRLIATYSFAAQEWRITPITLATAPLALPVASLFVAGFLWWMVLVLIGPPHHTRWWLCLVATGVWLGVAVSWRF